MDIQSEKLQIIEQLLHINNEAVIKKIKQIVISEDKFAGYMSEHDEERLISAVKESEADFKAGRVHTHEEVGKHIKKRIATLKK